MRGRSLTCWRRAGIQCILPLAVRERVNGMNAVAKWGNSLGVRLPKHIVEQAHLSEGTPIEFSVEDGRVILSPIRRRYKLSDLLADYKPEHRHGEAETRRPVGKASTIAEGSTWQERAALAGVVDDGQPGPRQGTLSRALYLLMRRRGGATRALLCDVAGYQCGWTPELHRWGGKFGHVARIFDTPGGVAYELADATRSQKVR